MAEVENVEEALVVDQTPAPSLADVAPAVFRNYFATYPNTFLTQHHIQSYEAFVFREMMDIIQAENPITILKEPIAGAASQYKYKSEIFLGGDSKNPADLALEVGAPIITLDKGQTVRRMFPNEARIRNLSYAANFQCDILVRTTFTSPDPANPGKFVSEVEELRVPKFKLFNLPILLRSKLCATHGADKDLLWEMGECRNDQGGYFIVDGSEKVLITRQEQAYNSLYCATKPTDLEIATYASVICQHPVTKQSRRVALYRLHEREGIEEGVIRVSVPYVKGAIPLFVLFRALGVESDEEIVRMILPDVNSPMTQAMETTLIPCIQDAWPLTNQTQAIEFIKTLTKGFVIADVLNILRTHLFSHVPDRPLARAQYLAEIVRKMIRIEMRLEPNVNRDDIRNQRLLPTGTLLRGLFSECWKDWKKAVRLEVDKLYNYNKPLYQDRAFLNLFSTGNLNTVLTTKVLNDSIMRGFRGKWGTSQYNMKTGVIQPLARISYMDAMSHTRRVVSDFDTSMKLVGPRQLHPSQVGYFCTSETPSGGHIGATKNLSILTAVSIAVEATPIMNWLFSRGGVIEVSAASTALRATATSVQINGGTIGFTLNPVLLTRVLKYMKWTACLPPTTSISFNTSDNILRIYLDDGRPLRPLYHLSAGGKWPAVMVKVKQGGTPPDWRTMVCGTLPATADKPISSAAFVDPLSARATDDAPPTLEDYEAELAPAIGCVEYIDPYEGNEAYISWWGREDNLTPEHTHVEIHPSSLMGLVANMIPFANHNQSPRNQLSCSQSKQGIGYYATNYESRFDTYGSMLCYGEGALCRTIVHDAVAGGEMPYGTNLIFALLCFNGYNQDDGILFNRSSIERGLFRSLALRSYETVEEEDPVSKAVYKIGNPRSVLSWTDLRPGLDYTGLDDNGIIKEGTVIHDKTVLVARYVTNKETNKISDASLLPTVFTKGRVDKVVVLHQANGMRLVRVRILEERVPELGDKFSSRHGQKGTMGMLMDAVDMPRTKDGMVPDVVVNPHCIPSRMTVAQLLEQVFGKFGASVGAKINSTSFMNDGDSFTAIANALQALGLQRDGEEILYSGITGDMYTSSVFMAPLYFMRLKHLTQDKQNSRGAGRKEIRTHQPTGGRGNEGGMRVGEMERDSLIAHGVTSFLQESMMRRSDGSSFVVCNGCGTIPIYNPAQNLYVCALCDGPLTFQGSTVETLGLVLPVRKSRTTFSRIETPYALKLLDQEMTTFMNGGLRFLTEAGARRFREPTEMDELDILLESEELATAVQATAPPKKSVIAKPPAEPVAEEAGGPAADEDAPPDNMDEGQPASNLLPALPAIPAGTQVIKFYSKIPEYKEFGNYYHVDLMIDGLRYRSVEHYFQAMKFPDHPEYQEAIRQAKKARDAKRMGKTEDYATRVDWATYRDTVMMKALREKFSDRHPELKELLLGTGNAILQDASPRDNYWGIGSSGMGQNKLGVMLMAIRDELRGGLPASESGGNALTAAFDAALLDRANAPPPPAPGTEGNMSPVVVINTGVPAQPQPVVENPVPPTLVVEGAPATAPYPQLGGGGAPLSGGTVLAPGPYPIVNAFNPAPSAFDTTILGAQANTPACGQVPSTGATAQPSIAPVAVVPEPEYKNVFVTSDPNAVKK